MVALQGKVEPKGRTACQKNRYLVRVKDGCRSSFELKAWTLAEATRKAERLSGGFSFTIKELQTPTLLATIVYLLGQAFGEAKR